MSTILQGILDLLTSFNGMLYIAGYIVGGIPFGYILAKTVAGVNVKEHGSGNIGATNVLRVLKSKDPKLAKKLGALTLFLDALKGAAVILLAKYLGANENVIWGVALFSVIGHCYSPFLKFEGGKGVATAFGVILVLIPKVAIIALVIWIIVAKVLKVSSLAALVALVSIIITSNIMHSGGLPGINSFVPLYIIIFIVFYKHIPNIKRLLSKEETKI